MPNTRKMAKLSGIPHSDILKTLSKVVGPSNVIFLTSIGKTDDGENVFFVTDEIAQKIYAEFTTTAGNSKEESTHGGD